MLEFLTTTFFATMPLWFLPTIGRLMFNQEVPFEEAVKSGELFVYSAALAGPLIYTITKRYGNFSTNFGRSEGRMFSLSISFPYGIISLAIAGIACVLSGFAFTFLKNPAFTNPHDLSRLNFRGIVILSWVIFLALNLVLFCVTAYRNMLDDVSRSNVGQEDEFLQRWIENKK